MRRLLIDKDGNPKQILEAGEQKNIMSDRVILVPGPIEECKTIDQIFDSFVNKGISTKKIAEILNSRFEETGKPSPWGHATILNILQNEKYMGNNVYNRKSNKLRGRTIMNPPEEWVRANNVFEPLVSKKIFAKAQKLIKQQRRSMSDEDMLMGLEKLYKKTGYLSGEIIDNAKNIPSVNAYIVRFRSLYTAYELAGFHHNKRERSEEELLVKLKNLYKKHGYLSSGLIDQTPDMPCRDIYRRRFGSTKKAYQLVGYTQDAMRLPPKVMLARLAKLYNKHGYLTENIVNNSQLTPRGITYRKAFGSLVTAYLLIGYDPETLKVTNKELIDNLKQIYKQKGYLSGPLIDASDFPYNRGIYSNRFGSLPNAYATIGYKTEKYGISNEVMIIKLKELYEEIRRLSPKIIDACEDIPCNRTYINRFGSQKIVYALCGYKSDNKQAKNLTSDCYYAHGKQ